MMLNRVKLDYKNNKKRLREQARDKYKNLSVKDQKQKERIWKKQIS